MAVNTVLEGNILKIDDGVKIEYWNAGWVSISFDTVNVILSYNNDLLGNFTKRNPYTIPMADFQYDGTPAVTEAAIATALSTIIG